MVFVHYSSEQTAPSNVHLDHQAIATHLAKQLHLTLTESFGTEKDKAFFNIYHKDQLLAGANGKSIKTLRKKVYKVLVEVLSERLGGV